MKVSRLLATLVIAMIFSKVYAIDVFNTNHYSLAQTSNKQIGNHYFKKIYDKELKRFRLIQDTVILKFNDTAKEETIKNYLNNLGLEIVSDLGEKTFLCQLIDADSNENFITKLNSIKGIINEESHSDNSLVEQFDLNEYRKVELLSTEESLENLQWHLNNDGINGYKEGADINVHEAWQTSKGEGVKIAVIDTGIDPKLKKKVNIFGKGINARVTDQSMGKEKNKTAVAPINSRENHATAIIGIINAKGNDQGLMGVAPESTIIPIRLIDDSGISSTAQIIYAFQKADELGAQIINCSWGSSGQLLDGEVIELSNLEKDLYQRIAKEGNHGKGILIVFASGNKGYNDLNASPEARFEDNFSVAATDSGDRITSYSNLGKELDIVAPGGKTKPIYTYDRTDFIKVANNGKAKTIRVEGYEEGCIAKNFKGTSASSAIVSGVAALVLSANPSLSAEEIKDILRSSSDPIKYPERADLLSCGSGRVNAGKAVERALE